MAEDSRKQDPLDLIRSMWSNMGSNMGLALPGMVGPALNMDQMDRRISELKVIEEWLRVNLNMLQTTIHTLEVQRTTLATVKAIGQTVSGGEGGANPFINPALWPWNLLQPQAPSPETPKTPTPEETPKK
jgi:hypothetical protein